MNSDFLNRRIVDLSHPLNPSAPCWPGDPVPEFETLAHPDTDGFFLRRFSLGEHTGTHVNAPASFHPGGASIDEYPPSSFVVPAIVIDARPRALANPDYRLGVNVLLEWERDHGPIPAQCLAIFRSGWEERWTDLEAYLGLEEDGSLNFPGFSAEATGVLLTQRGVAGIGIDTHGVDGGRDTDFSINRRVLERKRLVLENLCNLDQLPPTGTMLVIGILRLEGGSGSPASVLAFVP
ncbi:MAG: cyclase family protein [Chloroflexi bacterium]|nr:cyclase family protein [Chloroflexota bacterium]